MTLEKTLAEFGLNKSKALVYLSLLKIGSGSALEIAKDSGLLRTTVHEILQQLVSLGLISFVEKARGKIYFAEDPSKIKSIIKEKEKLLDSVLPELKSLFSGSIIRPKVKVFEGLSGIKTVFEDTLTAKDKLLMGILSMEDLYKIPGKKFMKEYTKKRIDKGIKLKVVRSEQKEIEEIWPSSIKENRELHYAPQEMVFPTTMYLYDNKVSVIGTQKENFGTIIESADFYNTLKNMFEIMWQVTRIGKKKD